MKDRQGGDARVEHVGAGVPSPPGEVAGDVETWSVALPDGLNLKASPHLEHQPPAWPGSSLRRRMLLTATAFAVALTAVVIAAGFGLCVALAPFTAGSVRTSGAVTSQQPHTDKNHDYCTLGIAYTLGGQQRHATVESGQACKPSLQPGTQVQLALNPDNPSDIAVLGTGIPGENAWKGIAILAPIMAGMLGFFLLFWSFSYRSTKRLFSQETPWHNIIATVQGRTESRSGTTLYLEAQDTTGKDRIFTILFNDRGPRPKPKPGDKLDFALLGDGAARAAVSVKGENRLHLVTFSVPNDFQLRALGL